MGTFFVQKITVIRKELYDVTSQAACCYPYKHDFAQSVKESFHKFKPLTHEHVRAFVQRSSKKSCALDDHTGHCVY